jgi:hypothetical protein
MTPAFIDNSRSELTLSHVRTGKIDVARVNFLYVRLRLTLTKALKAKGTGPLKCVDSFGNPLWFANAVHKGATIKETADVVAIE